MTNKSKKISLWFIFQLLNVFSQALANCPNEPLDITNAAKTVNKNARAPYHVGDSFMYTCNDPLQAVSPQITVCQEVNGGHVWSLDAALPTCKRTRCSPPAPILQGAYTPVKNTYEVGEKVTYECVSGYATLDAHESLCRISGEAFTWELDPQLPTCVQVCKDPDQIENAVYSGSNPPYFPGSVVTYQCKYFLSGLPEEAEIHCNDNANWNRSRNLGNLPKCYCSSPPTVTNGVFYPEGPYLPGAEIKYTCNFGFVPAHVGNYAITCKTTGDWEVDKFPTCNEATTAPTPYTLRCLTCTWRDIGDCYYASNGGRNLPVSSCDDQSKVYSYCTSEFVINNGNILSVERGCKNSVEYRPASAPPPSDDCVTQINGDIKCSFNCRNFRCNLVSANDLRFCANCGKNSYCNYRTGLCRCVSGFAGADCQTKFLKNSGGGVNPGVSSTFTSSASTISPNLHRLLPFLIVLIIYFKK